MDKNYKLLYNLLKISDLNKLVNTIFKKYSTFIKLNQLIAIDISDQKNNFDLKLYAKNDYSNNNLYFMFELLHFKFLKMTKKYADRLLKYHKEVNGYVGSGDDYIVLATNSEFKLDIFKVYLLFYYVECKINGKDNYMGVDFEFNTKKVALMQINFEQSNIDLLENSLIFLFDPNQLNKNWRTFFVQKIICSENSYKILHGSDSLDIPYLYHELLENNVNFIKKFTKNFIDTKFLCEYNYYRQGTELGKCKIYHILNDEKVISNDKLHELHDNEEKMGPIYDIIITIESLNEFLINYTLYDVLYLYHLLKNFKDKISDFELVNELTRYTFLEKRKISEYVPILEINKINNYMIKLNKVTRMNDVFNNKINELLNKYKNLRQLLKINYFKNNILMILKFIIYQRLCKKHTVYIRLKANETYDKDLLNYNYNFLNQYPNIKSFIGKLIFL